MRMKLLVSVPLVALAIAAGISNRPALVAQVPPDIVLSRSLPEAANRNFNRFQHFRPESPPPTAGIVASVAKVVATVPAAPPPMLTEQQQQYIIAVTRARSAPVIHYSAPAPSPPRYASGMQGVWACIRLHESGNNYAENTGNGYFGAYQWLPSSWNTAVSRIGHPEYANGRPDRDPPALQDDAAAWLQANSGWGQWPETSRMCGVR